MGLSTLQRQTTIPYHKTLFTPAVVITLVDIYLLPHHKQSYHYLLFGLLS